MKNKFTTAFAVTVLSCFLLAAAINNASAQSASNYEFQATTGNYADIGGGSTLTSIESDDASSGAISLGFTFNFCGTDYTQIYANSNGVISFSNAIVSYPYIEGNSSSELSEIQPAVMPLWDDLNGNIGTATYQTTGTAPNRVFTLECKNWKWYYGASSAAISYEVKLYESTNVIEYIYRQESGSVVSGSASIGIVDGSNNYLSLNNSSSSPTASSSTFTTSISSKPATGQIYRFIPPSPCSGQPTAGGIDAPSGACSGVPLTLSDTGATLASGLTYQWQERNPSITGVWTNIAGATSTTLSLPAGITSATDFRFIITCTNSSQSDTSASLTDTINPQNQCYCIPSNLYTYESYISNFTTTNAFQNVNQSNSNSTNGYIDFSNTDTIVAYQGSQCNFSITNSGYITSSLYYSIWVDWGQDGYFTQSGDQVATGSGSSPMNGTISVPMTADTGVTRLRVRSNYAYSQYDPCAQSYYGQAQDYAFYVKPLPSCSTTSLPSSLSLQADKDTLCISGDVSLSFNQSAIYIGGLTYQFQKSPDGSSNWTNVGAADSGIYISATLTVDTTTWYRCVISCHGTSIDTTNTVSVYVNDPQLLTYTDTVARCGPGSVTFSATASSGSTINWYDQPAGTAPIATGSSFTPNPSPTATTTYWITASTGPITVSNDTMGNGNYTYEPVTPFYGGWGGYNTEYLITASMLTSYGIHAGNITSLAFNIQSGTNTTYDGMAISMGMTSNSSITSPASGLTEVRSPQNVTVTGGAWNNYTFDSPFYWDGVSNLVIQVCWSNNNTYNNYMYAYSDYVGYTATYHRYYDNETPAVMCAGSGFTYSSTYQYLPQMAFNIQKGCQTPHQPVLAVIHPNPTANLGPDTNFCTGGSYTLHTGGFVGPLDTVLWSTNATSDSIAVSTPGTYSVTVTNQFGCVSSDTISISVHDYPPPVHLGVDTNLCDGESITLHSGNLDTSAIVLWSDGSVIDDLPVTVTGNYSVEVINQWGCAVYSDTAEVNVHPNPPSFNLGQDTSFCVGGIDVISPHNTDPNANVSWSTGSNADSMSVDSTGTYFVTVTNQYGCIASDTIHITTISYPHLDLGPADTNFCSGTQMTLDPGPQPTGTTFFWSTGASTQSIQALAGGMYIVIADHYGCQQSDTITLIQISSPTVNGITGTMQTNGTYHFVPVNPQNVNHYSWDFGDGNTDTGAVVDHTYAVNGNYTVTLVITNDCGSDTVLTNVSYNATGIHQIKLGKDELELYPNPATDLVTIANKSAYQMKSVVVYNVLGQVIYKGNTNNGNEYQLNVQSYASGMYNVKVFLTNGSWVVRRFEISK